MNKQSDLTRIVDGGYLSWAYGAIGSQAWQPVRRSFTRKAQTLICLDSKESVRKEYFPDYKSHRKDKRQKRPQIFERVVSFQGYLREDPSLFTWELPGLEADDLVAVLVHFKNLPVLGADKDLLQLPGIRLSKLGDESVEILNFARRQAKSVRNLIQSPRDILLALSLLGDKSDAVPRLIPSRQLHLFIQIIQSSNPFKVAQKLYGAEFERNLYLTALPSPWVFKKQLEPHEFYRRIQKGQKPRLAEMKPEIQKFINSVNLAI